MPIRKRWLISALCLILSVAQLTACQGAAITPAALASRAVVEQPNIPECTSSDWVQIPDTAITVYASPSDQQPVLLKAGESLELTADLPADGIYQAVIVYRPLEDILIKGTFAITVNDEEYTVPLYSLWKAEDFNLRWDRNDNQISPSQVTLDGFVQDYLKPYASIDKTPITFKLKSTGNRIKITPQSDEVEFEKILLVPYEEMPSYKEYIAGYPDSYGADSISLEAECYQLKSDSYIQGVNQQNSALSPYNYRKKYINTLNQGTFSTAGQKVLWSFTVKTAGFYNLSFSYTQTEKENMTVYRNIEIDGKVPFAEFQHVGFQYTGTDYKLYTLPYAVWLDAGKHTLALEAEGGLLEPYINQVREIMNKISNIGLELKKIASSSSDTNRTWDIEDYMPGVTETLNSQMSSLEKIYDEISLLQGKNASAAVNLKKAGDVLRNVLKKPDKLPTRLNELNEGSGSVMQYLADLITMLEEQPLGIDRIYISNDEKLPRAKSGFWTAIVDGIKRFFFTITNAGDDDADDHQVLKVWVNRPIQYVETMQIMADSQYSEGKINFRVNFSVMQDENKLILANSSGDSPDVAIGLASHTPYNLAIRSALHNFLEYPDFAEYIKQDYNTETLTPYIYGKGIYGVTETQDFYVLFYRTDIFEKLDLQPPKTWDDVKRMMVVLSRNSMNFYLPLAGWSGTKPLYTTVPFIYQSGGDLYSSDGLETAIQSENTIKGFTVLSDLFSKYSVQQNISSFYNSFRYGTVPVGVGSFNTYVQLMNAAPEIMGKWAIAPSPGFRREDGSICNVQPAADRACVVFESSDKKEMAWEYLKWWLSAETQTQFGYNMQTRYGVEYMWNTANLKAFARLQFPQEHKEVILSQWSNMREIVRHPATYMAERELSNAWTRVVTQGKTVRVSLDEAANIINREITRKMEEFGYLKDGKSVKEYRIYSIDELLGGDGR
ncbi:MAG TPA: extracellular solute-binding protein [Clostridiales bacterium]|nr:extracellular solute-binding protein [Clostridiales bacterium]